MNVKEAKELTEFGLWVKISSSIKERIEDACNDGEFEINVPNYCLSEEDMDRLVKLGYCITYDGSDTFDPRYYISWKW